MTLTQDEILQILKLVEESTFDELYLETGELKLIVKKGESESSAAGCSQTPPSLTQAVNAPVPGKERKPSTPRAAKERAPKSATVGDGKLPIKAPLLGTVYRRPAPESPPYVEIGSIVKEDDTVCLIEVMKVFTAVKAGVRGRITEVLVETNDLVEYGQPLFMVEPDKGAA